MKKITEEPKTFSKSRLGFLILLFLAVPLLYSSTTFAVKYFTGEFDLSPTPVTQKPQKVTPLVPVIKTAETSVEQTKATETTATTPATTRTPTPIPTPTPTTTPTPTPTPTPTTTTTPTPTPTPTPTCDQTTADWLAYQRDEYIATEKAKHIAILTAIGSRQPDPYFYEDTQSESIRYQSILDAIYSGYNAKMKEINCQV